MGRSVWLLRRSGGHTWRCRAEDRLTTWIDRRIFLVRTFQHVATRSRSHNGKDGFVIFKHGDHQDADVGTGRDDLARGLDAIDARHLNVDAHREHAVNKCALDDKVDVLQPIA